MSKIVSLVVGVGLYLFGIIGVIVLPSETIAEVLGPFLVGTGFLANYYLLSRHQKQKNSAEN